MEKQLEVRMHECHFEAPAPPPGPACGGLCYKFMKNLLLALTVLGKAPDIDRTILSTLITATIVMTELAHLLKLLVNDQMG